MVLVAMQYVLEQGHANHVSIGQVQGLADSLKEKCCGSWFDDATTPPDQKGYGPAERIVLNQIHS